MNNITLICSNCNESFEKPINEYNRKLKLNKNIFFCSVVCWSNYKKVKHDIITSECIKCGNEFTQIKEPSKKLKKCCSSTCANSRAHSDETKKTLSNITKKLWETESYREKMGNVIQNSRRFTSLGEIEIRTHIINKYPNDLWTFGHLFDRISGDLFSHKLKICIEYDGVWHFKDIHGQLKQKQDIDKKLKHWCDENNYRLIRIKEDVYKSNKQLWLSKIEDSIYNDTTKFVEFY